MNLKKLLLISTGLVLAASPAFADDEAGAAADANATTPAGGASAGMDANGNATGAATPAADMAGWSRSVIDRPLTVLKGKLGAEADLVIAHVSITIAGMTASNTSEGLAVGAAYGISDKLEAGAFYAFSLHSFEIKGRFTPFAAFSLMHSDKLDVAAGANLSLDLNGTDAMGGSQTDVAIDAGLGVRYKVTPKIAVFTGSPFAPGPVGQHLHLGLSGNTFKTFAIPVGVGLQATPELFAYLDTTLATIAISDPGMGSRVQSIADATPINLGAWFSLNANIDVGGVLNFPDVQHAGDFYAISLGARYFN